MFCAKNQQKRSRFLYHVLFSSNQLLTILELHKHFADNLLQKSYKRWRVSRFIHQTKNAGHGFWSIALNDLFCDSVGSTDLAKKAGTFAGDTLLRMLIQFYQS